VDGFLEIAGLITRWVMAALACWWFFLFITLIGASSDNAQYLAGTALMKAVICGGAAGIWFYRARTAKAAMSLREYSLKSQQTFPTELPRVISAPEPHQDTQPAAVLNAPLKASEPQGTTKMICDACGKESASEFNFCPHCGKAFVSQPSVIESPSPSPEVHSVTDTLTNQSEPIEDGVAGSGIRVGTLVFGVFSVICLLVSIAKGLVPIYLLEAAGWAGLAWYWQGKKTHSDVAKAIVIVLAVLVAIGEAVHIASQPDSKSTAPTASDPFAAYGGHEVASAEASATSHIADVEKQAVVLFSQKQYKEARPLFEQACNGTDENGFKYAGFDGEMKACNYLGYLYAQGLGGAHETKKARDAYQKACDQGILPSCASLGSLYQDAGDSGNARKYFQKACDGGVAEGCDLLRGVK
jgi:hypothetical protein